MSDVTAAFYAVPHFSFQTASIALGHARDIPKYLTGVVTSRCSTQYVLSQLLFIVNSRTTVRTVDCAVRNFT